MIEFDKNNFPIIQKVKIYVESGLNIKNACKKIGKSKYLCFKNATSEEKKEIYAILKKHYYRNSAKYLSKKKEINSCDIDDILEKIIETIKQGNCLSKACIINKIALNKIKKYLTKDQKKRIDETSKEYYLSKKSLYTDELFEKIKLSIQEGNSFHKSCKNNNISNETDYKNHLSENQKLQLKKIIFEIQLKKYPEI